MNMKYMNMQPNVRFKLDVGFAIMRNSLQKTCYLQNAEMRFKTVKERKYMTVFCRGEGDREVHRFSRYWYGTVSSFTILA